MGKHLFFQIFAGYALWTVRYFFRRSAAYHSAAFVSTFRTEVNDVVATFYDIHVMLNHYYGMSFLYK